MIMILHLCGRKLMMQSSLREENLFQAGILPQGSRPEFATGIKFKGSPWEVICVDRVRNRVGLVSYGQYFAEEQAWER